MSINVELHNMLGGNIDVLGQIEQEGTDKKLVIDNTVLLNLQGAKFLWGLVKLFGDEWDNSL